MNESRINFITQIFGQFNRNWSGQNVLDVGCGGGILSLNMARLGATVKAIDLSAPSIAAAQIQAVNQGLTIDFQTQSLEQDHQSYNLVTCMEVLEHVENAPLFFKALGEHVEANGLLVISTINRNWWAKLIAIVGAEYLIQKVPRGTHEYAKFIEPAEVCEWAGANSLKPILAKGLTFNLRTKKWQLSDNLKINYCLGFIKI